MGRGSHWSTRSSSTPKTVAPCAVAVPRLRRYARAASTCPEHTLHSASGRRVGGGRVQGRREGGRGPYRSAWTATGRGQCASPCRGPGARQLDGPDSRAAARRPLVPSGSRRGQSRLSSPAQQAAGASSLCCKQCATSSSRAHTARRKRSAAHPLCRAVSHAQLVCCPGGAIEQLDSVAAELFWIINC